MSFAYFSGPSCSTLHEGEAKDFLQEKESMSSRLLLSLPRSPSLRARLFSCRRLVRRVQGYVKVGGL